MRGATAVLLWVLILAESKYLPSILESIYDVNVRLMLKSVCSNSHVFV
jgi:hypothetical protein